ncbi:HNH endonuclease domain-containing protein [Methanogenium sp. MK-MG]|uniref:HNH endonuclease domain-containing protein n=1 Tax=Methanogenium sp. MK-MG TaxID=2599926 RepID=UPI0013ED7A21|nr:HNH endonuclease domain-containing protein [Methanogenium sp. MK-MG]KAF1078384.1 hypothetical protein MKMG_00719 [Methanogenium sp. MK-MG]
MEISSLRTINAILEHDAKDASYKYALIRGTIDVCQKYSHRKEEADGRVFYPLGSLVESWVLYYYPIIASPEFIPQRSGESEESAGGRQIVFRPAFKTVTDYYQDKGGFSAFWNEYRRGELPEEISADVMALFKKIRETIVALPMKYIGRSLSDAYYSIYGYDKQGIRIQNDAYPDPVCIQENFGVFDIPSDMCLAFEYFGSFISGEESILKDWTDFSHDKSTKSVQKAQIFALLTKVPETERAVGFARMVYQNAFREGPLECVWSGKRIPDSTRMHVDHMLPFARWKNNDLWNLLPALDTVNGNKSDQIPSRSLLEKREDVITYYWNQLHQEYPAQFEREVTLSLLGKKPEGRENWKEEAFANLLQKADYLIDVRGYESWECTEV